jgi:hypothetical protein
MARDMRVRLRHRTTEILSNDHLQKIQAYLPPLNFITLHYAYFILTCLVASIIFYCSSRPTWDITYTDSLYLVVSAMTEAGLNTVNLSTMTTFQQVILFLLICCGSQIFVSIATVLARKRVFESRFKHLVKLQKDARRTHRRSMSAPRADDNVARKLDSAQKPENPSDMSDFESRHSMPRDPITLPSASHAAAGAPGTAEREMADQEEGRAGASFDSSATQAVDPADVIGAAPSPRAVHYADSPSGAGPGYGQVLSFVGVGSTSYRLPFAAAGDGIYNRGRKKEKASAEEEPPLNHSEYVAPLILIS